MLPVDDVVAPVVGPEPADEVVAPLVPVAPLDAAVDAAFVAPLALDPPVPGADPSSQPGPASATSETTRPTEMAGRGRSIPRSVSPYFQSQPGWVSHVDWLRLAQLVGVPLHVSSQ